MNELIKRLRIAAKQMEILRHHDWAKLVTVAAEAIEDMQPKKGKWVDAHGETPKIVTEFSPLYCSRCGCRITPMIAHWEANGEKWAQYIHLPECPGCKSEMETEYVDT